MPKLIIPRANVSVHFYPFFNRFHRYEFLFGGRGSGKTKHIIIKLLARAAVDEYFLCIYARKVHDAIRDSQFGEFKAVARMMGWYDEFKFNESDYTITCRRNGNKFVAKGLDKAEKVKSTVEPTHVWVEEADQISWDDFDTLNKGLRSPATQNSFILSFNTFIPEQHWIRTTLFHPEHHYELSNQFSCKDTYLLHSTYLHNDFIDQEEYRDTLTLESGGNAYKIESDLKGLWGQEPNDNPWLYSFEPGKHIKPTLPFYPSFPVYLSFDFNNDPFACIAAQFSPNKGANSSFIHIIREFSGKMKVEQMCDQIKAAFPASIIYITGDRSGHNEDLGRNQTLYQIISSYLGVSDKLVQLNNSNLEHADSRILCNTMLANYPNFFISAQGCPNLVSQCEAARVDEKSSKPSQLLKDREQHKNDEFDGFRYLLQTYFHKFAKEKYFRILRK